jgi:iron(III) transport system substrate-binding protein
LGIVGAVAASTGVLIGSSQVAHAQSGEVVFYNAGRARVGEPLAAAFNKHYPKIKVLRIGGGSSGLSARITAEKDNPQCDVVSMNFPALNHDRSRFITYKSKHHAAFTPATIGPENKWYPYTVSLQVIMVNKDLVPSSETPKSFKDLADPKWKGKILMPHPAVSGAGYKQISQILQLHGWDVLGKIIDNAVFLPKVRMVLTNVSRGEHAIALAEESKVFGNKDKGYPVDGIYPAEGVAIQVGGIAICKGGPNPKNAFLFAEFMNSLEAHNINVSARNRRTGRLDSNPPKGLPKITKLHIDQSFNNDLASRQYNETLKKFDELLSKKKKIN